MLCSYFAPVSHLVDNSLNRENATGVPSLGFLQALEIIEAPASGVIADQPSVITVKALVTLGRIIVLAAVRNHFQKYHSAGPRGS
jgi:hypothetical protein